MIRIAWKNRAMRVANVTDSGERGKKELPRVR